MHFVEQFVLKDEVILVFYMTLTALESLTDVKYSEIKVKCVYSCQGFRTGKRKDEWKIKKPSYWKGSRTS